MNVQTTTERSEAISRRKEANVNERIAAFKLRVIDDDGAQLGVLDKRDALALAKEKGLDLVEVSPGSDPPVCRIMDFGKFKYQQSKRAQEAKKKQTVILVKEVKLRPKTEEHDLQTKIRHVIRFLKDGNKAKVSVVYRGREMAHQQLGYVLLEQVVEAVKDVAVIERQPKMEGRMMSMLLGPKPAS